MPTRKPSLQRRSRQHTVAAAMPAHPQFRMRLLTLAVLSACASVVGDGGAERHTQLPAGTIPTGGVVSSGSATILAPQATAAGQLLQINQTSAQGYLQMERRFQRCPGQRGALQPDDQRSVVPLVRVAELHL